jgi:predicted metal-dependent peptidase
MLAAAQTADGAGNIPAGVLRLIKNLTEPKMNWRELLRMQLESTIKSDFTWLRSSRRGWHMDAVMPGMKLDPMIDIVVAIDASGSMDNDQLQDILSEIQGIMESFPAFRVTIMTFDTEVYNVKQYDSDSADNMLDYEVQGGGGTDFDCVWHYLKKEEIEPKRLVMFTDGHCYTWGDPNYCDTVWIIHSNPHLTEVPHGILAHYEDNID